MTKSGDPSTENEIWGTCEELLLACAVDRHGIHSWDTISTEIRSRSSCAHRLTAGDCKRRFLLLKSRFDGGDQINGRDRSDQNPTVGIPWLDELRKLRVDELRRELRRHDVSIGSLELKVKRLKEERERSLKKADAVNGSGSGSDAEPKEKNDRDVSPRRSPEDISGDRLSGEDSGRSCKESNNTEPKAEVRKVEVDRAVIGSRSGSVNESVGEWKEEGTKESSDVQSSASLSRRRRRRSAVHSVTSVESQPLIDFLEIIRSNKEGSVFNRRLESQESVRYRSLIRRHVDLEIVRHRIRANGYTSAEFFRDLLLLCNNAIVFYTKNSSESISAVHLRGLINKEIAAKLRKTPQTSPQSICKEPTPPPPPLGLQPSKLKSDPERIDAGKPTSLPSLVACRRRSSIAAKPAKPGKPTKKVEKEEKVEEEETEKDEVAEEKSTKRRAALPWKSRTGRGGRGGANVVVKDPTPEPVEQEMKPSTKKRGAASFLNRIKLSPSSPNGKGNETTKSPPSLSKSGSGEQQKTKHKEDSKKQGVAAAAAAAKRNVGRPPKRGVAPAKRAREEKTPPPLPRKRGRR